MNLGNPYTFVGNNPWTWLDPWGLKSEFAGHGAWGERAAAAWDAKVQGVYDLAFVHRPGAVGVAADVYNFTFYYHTQIIQCPSAVLRTGVGTAEGVVGYDRNGNRLSIGQRVVGVGGDALTVASAILPAKQFGGFLSARFGPKAAATAPAAVPGAVGVNAARGGPAAAAPKPLTPGAVRCEGAVESAPSTLTGRGYGVADPAVRIPRTWAEADFRAALQGRPPSVPRRSAVGS